MTLETVNDTTKSSLQEFANLSVKSINPTLDEYLKSISRSGDTCYNWCLVKSLLCYKMERVLEDFMEVVIESADESAPSTEEFNSTKERLCALLNGFYRAPFTVQRFLELLLEPNKHYKKFDKYCRGLEKVLSVVTTVDPFHKISNSSLLPNTVLNGNGLMDTVEEDKKPLVNGDVHIESVPNNNEDTKKRPNDTEETNNKRQKIDEEEVNGGGVSPDSTTNEMEISTDGKQEDEGYAENNSDENQVTTTMSEEKVTTEEAVVSDNPNEQTKGG